MDKEVWERDFDSQTREWCAKVAGLVADALATAGVVAHDQLERVVEVATEEIYARLCVRDYPPSSESSGQ